MPCTFPRILVTGASGQLAQAIKAINNKQHSLPQHVLLSATRHELDISEPQSIEKALAHYQPHTIINTAAYTNVDQAESEQTQAHLINARAIKHLAQACAKRHIRLVHISTDYVFDGQALEPYAEYTPPNPINIYGQTKLAGEQALLAALPHGVILRTGWVFSQYGHNFLKTMLRLAQQEQALSIITDQIGGPSYALDVARVVTALALHPQAHGIYHFTGSPAVSWFEFASEIFQIAYQFKLLKHVPPIHAITSQEYPTKARRPKNSVLSMERLNKLGIATHQDWRLGIKTSLSAMHAESPLLHRTTPQGTHPSS